MKATWGHKVTKCLECSRDIEKGQRRLTDTIYLERTKRVARVHYHPKCYVRRVLRWWGENPYNPQGRGGRKALPIDPENMARRRVLLKRLSYLRRTYGDDARHAVADMATRLSGGASVSVAEALEGIDMEKQEAYYALRKETVEILNELSSPNLGGLPPHLRSV